MGTWSAACTRTAFASPQRPHRSALELTYQPLNDERIYLFDYDMSDSSNLRKKDAYAGVVGQVTSRVVLRVSSFHYKSKHLIIWLVAFFAGLIIMLPLTYDCGLLAGTGDVLTIQKMVQQSLMKARRRSNMLIKNDPHRRRWRPVVYRHGLD